MTLPPSLPVALKEWAVVCDALGLGRQIILLRKGGIIEARRGFAPQHQAFVLFPTYLHQNQRMVKSSDSSLLAAAQAAVTGDPAQEPSQIRIAVAALVSDVIQVRSRAQIDALNHEHIWTAPLIDMRFEYRPQNPLYLMLARAYRLKSPVTLASTPAYAGCKSWVPLDQPIATQDAVPALDDAAYEARREKVLRAMD